MKMKNKMILQEILQRSTTSVASFSYTLILWSGELPRSGGTRSVTRRVRRLTPRASRALSAARAGQSAAAGHALWQSRTDAAWNAGSRPLENPLVNGRRIKHVFYNYCSGGGCCLEPPPETWYKGILAPTETIMWETKQLWLFIYILFSLATFHLGE